MILMASKHFRILTLLVLALALACLTRVEAFAADAASITDNGDGTAKLAFNNGYDEKIKLIVQLGSGKQYKYDIPKGNVNVNIPLTQGNGEYKLILCRNISGTKYSVLQTVKVNQKLSKDETAFLTSNIMIDWNTTNDAIKQAQKLVKGKKKTSDKISAIHSYIVKNYSYDYDKAKSVSGESGYVPNISTVYKNKKGICYDISVLMASMLRSVGVPAKVVTGNTPNANTYHAWNNVYDSSWKIMDATYDLQLYKAGKKYDTYKKASDYKDIVYTY